MPHSESNGRPSFPINLLADFAGGGLTAATGVLLALLEKKYQWHRSGRRNRHVRMTFDLLPVHTSGAGLRRPLHIILSSHPSSAPQPPLLQPHGIQTRSNGGAPYYGVYLCKDARWFTVGALEPQFYVNFLNYFLGSLPTSFSVPVLDHGPAWRPRPEDQSDREEWANTRAFFEAGFLTKTRDEWTAVFHGLFQ